MKLRNLFFASVALAGLFSACSNEMDEVVDNATNAGDAFMSVGFSFPSATNTRANGDQEVGDKSEQSFSNIALVIVNAANTTVLEAKILPASEFTPNGGTGGAADGNDKIYLSNKVQVTAQKTAVNVYVFVNPTAAISALTKDAPFEPKMIYTAAAGENETLEIAKTNNFLMSNMENVSTPITGTSTNPTAIKVKVERVSAKLMEQSKKLAFDTKYEVGTTKKDLTIKLEKFAYTNLNKTSFILRQTNDGYFVDTNFDRNSTADDFFYYNASSATTTGYNFIGMNGTDASTRYCLENTTKADLQYTNNTTGVIYQAKAIWAGETEAKSFYTYVGNVYFDFASLKAAYELANGENTLDTQANVEAQKVVGVAFYKDGICYYRTMIKHDPQDTYLGKMEFGVVRNNVYKLSVNSIKGLGQPVIPSTDEPDEPNADEAQLNLTVVVTPWTVRDNNFDL